MLKREKSLRLPSISRGLPVIGLAVGVIALVSHHAAAADPESQPAQNASTNSAKLVRSYGKLPLSFEANLGQVDKTVQFMARGAGYGLYLSGQEAVLTLRKPFRGPASKPSPALPSSWRLSPNGNSFDPYGKNIPIGDGPTLPRQIAASHRQSTTDIVRMQLVGANAVAAPTGEEKLPGTANYFLGNDPLKWHTAIPTYGEVRYAGVYDGIDLVYYGNQQQLEYDFVLAPGASTRRIRLHFAGAHELKLDAEGNLDIVAADGSIAFKKPVVYQVVDGERKLVGGRFTLLADSTVGFHVGRYDHAKALVIDPTLAYSTFFGGSTADFVATIAVDSAGEAFVGGITASNDFPVTPGAFQPLDYATSTNEVSTAYISKFNASGTALLYSTYLGGDAIPNTVHEQGDYVKGIAVDSSGDAYVTGYTYSSDFPITTGAFQTTNEPAGVGSDTGFVTKLNPTGTELVYSTYLGGNVLDELTALTIDSAGDAYISGITFSSTYPTTTGAYQTSNKSASVNGYNSVITKLNPTGSGLLYSTYLGGTSSYSTELNNFYWTNPIVVDSSGNVYVAGFTAAGDFPVTAGAYQTKNNGTFNITVSKLNPTLSKLAYSTYLGGSTTSVIEGLAVDGAGNAYVAGYTSDMNFPVTTGAFQTTNDADTNTVDSAEANQNGFLTKINPTGTGLVYSTYLGGTTGPWGGDEIYDLALDGAGDAYVTGSAMSSDFPVTSNAYQSTNHGATHCCDYLTYTSNAFLTEFNPEGAALIYSTYLGGSGTQNPAGPGGTGDEGLALALGPNQNVYLGGYTSSPNFPVTPDAFNTVYNSHQNMAFVADFDLGPAPSTTESVTTLTTSANSVVPGTALTFTAAVTQASGSVVPAGSIVFSIDEASVGTVALNSSGKATYSTSALPAGEHYVLATYAGNATFSSSGDGLDEFIVPATPVVTPPSGTYESQQTVTITDATNSALFYYTLDGSAPTVFSTQYTAPIVVDTSKTIKVIAVSNRTADSAEVSNTYTIIGSPAVLAAPATAVGAANATLNAYVNTLGLAGSYYFQYGTSSASLTSSTAKTALSASTTRAAVSTSLTTLAAATKYYYQVVVTTAGGTTTGNIQSFTTN
jgi:hypothetical protein